MIRWLLGLWRALFGRAPAGDPPSPSSPSFRLPAGGARVVREIEVAGFKVQVMELTVAEIRAWLKDSGMVSGDLVDAALFENFSLPDVVRMTDLTTESIATLTPSDIHQVMAVCEEVNADFFAMRSRALALGRAALSGVSKPPL
jgi:hypothetical protein